MHDSISATGATEVEALEALLSDLRKPLTQPWTLRYNSALSRGAPLGEGRSVPRGREMWGGPDA